MKDVAAGIIINNGKILIGKRAEGQKMDGKWEFPGGKIEAGETPEEALKREIMEEFSADIEVGKFFSESKHKYEFGEIRLLAYIASSKNREFKLSVHSEIKWVSPEDIKSFDYAPADIPVADKIYKEL